MSLHIINPAIDNIVIHFVQVLNLAVLAILITAPLGSFLISILGPLLLDRPTLEDIELNCTEEKENEMSKPLKREEEDDESVAEV